MAPEHSEQILTCWGEGWVWGSSCGWWGWACGHMGIPPPPVNRHTRLKTLYSRTTLLVVIKSTFIVNAEKGWPSTERPSC